MSALSSHDRDPERKRKVCVPEGHILIVNCILRLQALKTHQHYCMQNGTWLIASL